VDQLKDALRLEQVPQPVLAEVTKAGVGGKPALDQLLNGM
jgi:hypothetical protein